MLKRILSIVVVLGLLLVSCTQNAEELNSEAQVATSYEVRNHSYANLSEINTVHLHLDLEIDFENESIKGVVRHKMENHGADKAIFDVKSINIEKVTVGEEGNETEVSFIIGEYKELLGSPLVVDIDENTEYINIYYSTTEDAEALDWLAPQLTADEKYPFLYTQGQAILTRTWIPIQDTPENRFTYTAKIKAPKELLVVMSAVNPKEKNETGEYSFEMNQPISSYLLSMAVGDLEFKALSENCGVYAEPSVIDAATKEFRKVPEMITAAQDIYGEYLWEVYDILVLPYSFPYGGMENPRLTFVTPTLIAGDESLVTVIAHELAHSWSGNLVTNASWDDFWLNEGFTTYFENRIMEEVEGKEVADMILLIEYQGLVQTVERFVKEGIAEETKLKLALDGKDPDDGMSDVAYTKGAFFLKTLEHEAGRERFDDFLRQYFNEFKFGTITTEKFVDYLNEHLLEKYDIDFNAEEWIYGEGVPSNCVKITSERFESIQGLAQEIKNGGSLPSELKRSDKITQEWLAFIREFGGELDIESMKMIDEQLHFRDSDNAEIMTEWFVLGVQNDYKDIRPDLEKLLVKVGRRKFLEPLYEVLANHSEESLEWGREVYISARPHYHAISYNTIDKILGL